MTIHRRVCVGGLACEGCAERIAGAVQSVDGVRRVSVAPHADAIEFVADDHVTNADVHAAIYDAGFEVLG